MQKNHAKAIQAFRSASFPQGKLMHTTVELYRDSNILVALTWALFESDDDDSPTTAPVVVLSHYGTAIALRTEDGETVLNATHYSLTTTRLQNALRSSLTFTYTVSGLPWLADGDDMVMTLQSALAGE